MKSEPLGHGNDNGLPTVRVSCPECHGRGSFWVYDTDSDPLVEWKLLWRRLKKLFGRKS